MEFASEMVVKACFERMQITKPAVQPAGSLRMISRDASTPDRSCGSYEGERWQEIGFHSGVYVVTSRRVVVPFRQLRRRFSPARREGRRQRR
jgi:hypothetical protein